MFTFRNTWMEGEPVSATSNGTLPPVSGGANLRRSEQIVPGKVAHIRIDR